MRIPWWKWPFWIKIAGQALLFWGIWKLVSGINAGSRPDRARLMPWLISGLAVYYAGRGLQIAARSRARRLAQREKEKEEA